MSQSTQKQLTCKICGKQFLVRAYRVKNGKLPVCSFACNNRKRMRSIEERFWENVQKAEDGCWLWTGNKDSHGYGIITLRQKRILAHRFSWELANGKIENGLYALHNCPGRDNKTCVNPSHLFLGTHADNMADAAKKGQIPRGERHSATHLTDDDIREIRRRAHDGETHESIAVIFTVRREAIGKIVRGERWKHVTSQ